MSKASRRYDHYKSSSTGNGGWIVGAIIVILVIIGLFYWGGGNTNSSSPECVLETGEHGVYYYRNCRGHDHAALLGKFVVDHPELRVIGPMAAYKGFAIVTEKR